MIKLLLVDDEVAICSGMKKLIARADGESFIVAEAYDGVEALDIIDEFVPDVLITDMRMPRMDGMQLLREAKRRKPDLLTAVVSAYSDYDFIREAMLMHASDYLLKPVTAKDLQGLLHKLKHKHEQLELEREQEALGLLMQGKTLESVPPSLQYSYYSMLLVCAGPYINGVTDDCPGEAFWQSPLFAEYWERFKPAGIRHWIVNGERSNERLVLLASSRDDAEETIRTGLDTFLQSIASEPIPVTIVAESGLSLNQLSASGRQLRRELIHSLVFAHSSILHLQPSPSRETDPERAFRAETARAMEAVEQQRRELFEEEFGELLQGWERHCATQYVIQQALFRALAAFGQHGLERQIDLDMLVSHSLSYTELRSKLSAFFSALFDEHQAAPRAVASYTIALQVEHFLKQNFRETITLQSLSREFGLVPNYLSVLFKKEKGITPLEYLMEFRINEAKRIMDEQPHMLLKQVASEVGYADQLYFSRVFKKLTGQSPTEYAQSRQH